MLKFCHRVHVFKQESFFFTLSLHPVVGGYQRQPPRGNSAESVQRGPGVNALWCLVLQKPKYLTVMGDQSRLICDSTFVEVYLGVRIWTFSLFCTFCFSRSYCVHFFVSFVLRHSRVSQVLLLRKQPTFRNAITGFPVKWRLRIETSAEIPYWVWWRVTTQNWVVLLIGRAAWENCFNQSEALPRSW